MKIEVGQDLYEVNGEKVDFIFQDAKKYLLAMLDDLEQKENGNEDLFLYLISVQSQIYSVLSSQMDKQGRETLMRSIGAKKLDETNNVHSDK